MADFLAAEMKVGRIPKQFLPLQSGVGNIANAVLAALGQSQDIPAFPARWFDGLFRALPGERPFLPPLPGPHRQAGIDARVAAPGPHDFTVRRCVSPGAST